MSYDPAARSRTRLELGRWTGPSGAAFDDLVVSFVDHGPAEAADIALVFSSLGGTAHRLDYLIGDGRALDPRSWRTIAIDALANGFSSSPSNTTGPYPDLTISDMVDSALLVLDELSIGRPVHVVGASMGGIQALDLAVRHPDRASSVVSMVPLACTPPWAQALNELSRRVLDHPDPDKAWTDWSLLIDVLADGGPDSLAGLGSSWRDRLDESIAELRRNPIDAADWRVQSLAYDRFDLGDHADGDWRAALARISSPTLVVIAEDDLYNPTRDQYAVANAIPRAHLHVIEAETGHGASNPREEAGITELNEVVGGFLDRGRGAP